MRQSIVMLYGVLGNVLHFALQKVFFEKNYSVYIPDWFELCKAKLDNQGHPFSATSELLITHLESMGVKNPILIGHSLGGAIALDMVARLKYPSNGLVILDTAVTPSLEKKESYHVLCDQLIESINDTSFIKDFFRKRFFSEKDNEKVIDALLQKAMTRLHPLWFQILAGAVDCDFPQYIRSLTLPTLYIGAAKPNANFKKIHQLNKAIKLTHVDSAGHFVTVLASEEVNHILQSWFEDVL